MNPASDKRPLLTQTKGVLIIACLTLGVFLCGGCGKKTASKSIPSAGQSENSAAEPVAANSSDAAIQSEPRVVPVAVPASADASAQLAQLTQLLRRFGMERRRVPQSLNELVAAGYLAVLPSAPTGKKFIIDGKQMQVTLENK